MNTSVYIDSSSLESWGKEFESINSECLTDLSDIAQAVGNLDGSFKGEVATAFADSINTFLNRAKKDHESMKDLNTFLNNVITVLSNQ